LFLNKRNIKKEEENFQIIIEKKIFNNFLKFNFFFFALEILENGKKGKFFFSFIILFLKIFIFSFVVFINFLGILDNFLYSPNSSDSFNFFNQNYMFLML